MTNFNQSKILASRLLQGSAIIGLAAMWATGAMAQTDLHVLALCAAPKRGAASGPPQPAAGRGKGQTGVAKPHTHVADGRRVRQVSLHPRDHQLRRQVFEQARRDPGVGFGVLEVDRVDLVRHGR